MGKTLHKIRTIFLIILILSAGKSGAQVISPPVPLYPATGDTLRILSPTFSWTPAYPLNPKLPYQYTFTLVEVLEGQTPEGAMLANPPYFEEKNLQTTTLTYPLHAPMLANLTRYAWQVKLNFQVGQGEVMTDRILTGEVSSFTLYDQMSNHECVPFLYTQLDERFYLFAEELKFKPHPESSFQLGQMSYRILNLKGQSVIAGNLSPRYDSKGDFYAIGLKGYDVFRRRATRNQLYILEATAKSGEVYQLKFTCR